MLRIPTLSVAVLCCLFLPACLIGSESKTVRRGDYVSDSEFALIEPGMSTIDVRELLGSPTKKQLLEDGGEVWKYASHVETEEETSILFVMHRESRDETHEPTTVIVFDTDKNVTRTWQE